MMNVLACIVTEHDPWLVLVAAIICVVGAWATLQLFYRACATTAIERAAWLVLTAVIAGAAIWCTHFIAMLGYEPGLPVGFDPVLTIVSLLVAITGVAGGFWVAANGSQRAAAALGGAIVGLAIAVMHYTGMYAYRIQGIVTWNETYLSASLVLSVVLSAAALHVSRHARAARRKEFAAGLLVLAIVGLHFTGMTAFKVDPLHVDAAFSNPAALRAMALAVAAVGLVIVGACWASSLIDTRARAEAADALANMSNGLVMVSHDGTVQLFNRRVLDLFDLDPAKVAIGMPFDDLLGLISSTQGWDAARSERIASTQGRWRTENLAVRLDHHLSDGTVLNIACQPMDGGGAIFTYDDVTEMRESQKKVAHLAFHDALTGLANRRRFADELSKLAGARFALLLIDLDRFKFVNDTFGHAVGDNLLVAVADRLRAVCKDVGQPFRLGGDEISLLIVDDTGSAIEIGEEIVRVLSIPFEIGSEMVSVGCSVGVAFSDTETDQDTIQQMADLALYDAKDKGRGRLAIYQDGMMEEAVRRRRLEADLWVAVEKGQFELHYQPLYQLPDRKVCGFEALIRWQHPENGLIPPNDFIPVAEQSGAILDIGGWVINEACRQLAEWPDDIYVSINVSPVQLRSANILQQVTKALADHQLLPQRVEIELTETAMVESNGEIAAALSGLRALGVRVAMDDFGTGYSSLAHLRSFELDRIKIDRSFVSVSQTDAGAAAVVRAITGMARDLAIETTGEGVETEDQLSKLISLGCGTAQGFFLGKPVRSEQATRLARADRPATGGAAREIA
ncbi:bifunctional diguanylate cyclase/phosphodiesterase [Pseudohoeflea coraliihabitans]|uniref:EAL domain-containing protein n=1 Tax=Pseudohoeflea coraliihabitans TaxID=2860393 RepID=A0ABS6WNG7_9HYPH|nr:EAL domain-containing protein [Pseudohoeflea sp. DP4N28-3]MBW3097435.1 EAL domain-containing protein [Pseudohoeflea sp. DP4N28-3]